MTVLEKLEKHNAIAEEDFDKMSKIIFHLIISNRNYINDVRLGKTEELITYFTIFLEKLQPLSSKKDKLALMSFIDKMNIQKERLELQRQETTIDDIQLAGKRLGKKSQSAFAKK